MVPGGELEHGVECDKRANFSNMEGGVHLKKMFKIEREREEGRREQKTNMRAKMNSQLISPKDGR